MWYFNGVMVKLSDSSKYNNSSMYLNESIIESTLNIINAESSDVGTYTCEATNIIGTDNTSGILSVNGKYPVDIRTLFVLCSYVYNIFTDAAEIFDVSVYKGESNIIKEGENITLRCIGVGFPPPQIFWSKLNGSLSDRVSSTNMLMLTNEGNVTRVIVDLILRGASREDTGVYECSASNLLNDVTEDISLTVQCMQFI